MTSAEYERIKQDFIVYLWQPKPEPAIGDYEFKCLTGFTREEIKEMIRRVTKRGYGSLDGNTSALPGQIS